MASTPEPILTRLWREHRPETAVTATSRVGPDEAPAWADLEAVYLWHERVAIMTFDGGLQLAEARRRTAVELGYNPTLEAEKAFIAICRFPHFPVGTG
ncbi:hypothetical protein D3C86_1815090 [compost metagenome]